MVSAYHILGTLAVLEYVSALEAVGYTRPPYNLKLSNVIGCDNHGGHDPII